MKIVVTLDYEADEADPPEDVKAFMDWIVHHLSERMDNDGLDHPDINSMNLAHHGNLIRWLIPVFQLHHLWEAGDLSAG